jgi:hypothetical protein
LFDVKDELCISHVCDQYGMNEWMLGCGIGAIGAKRMGKMLERNAALENIDLWRENPLNSHSSPDVVYCPSHSQMFARGEL